MRVITLSKPEGSATNQWLGTDRVVYHGVPNQLSRRATDPSSNLAFAWQITATYRPKILSGYSNGLGRIAICRLRSTWSYTPA